MNGLDLYCCYQNTQECNNNIVNCGM